MFNIYFENVGFSVIFFIINKYVVIHSIYSIYNPRALIHIVFNNITAPDALHNCLDVLHNWVTNNRLVFFIKKN